MDGLKALLNRLDGKGYKGYKELKGLYSFPNFDLNILKVQGDPFASPSLFEVVVDMNKYLYDKEWYSNAIRKKAFEDFILRKIYTAINTIDKRAIGSGKSGKISIYKPEQEILKRSASEIKDKKIHLKFYVGLPAQGRRILAKEALKILYTDIPKIVETIELKNLNKDEIELHIETTENAEKIREKMSKDNLIVFVANGSILARRSSNDDRVMEDAVKFKSPKSLEKTIELSNGFKITGMAIPKGITIITGGGFHGKSTLLNAIEMGVYNHIPGDGREYCISSTDSVKIRAEDGRSVEKVDISTFISNLPNKLDTTEFSTENASGSTSQAANIVEAIEMGCDTLLIDEDTSATNFMVRDKKIQELISKDKEPINPFIEKIESLRDSIEVSSIIVVGGLGDYLDVADLVLLLDEYTVYDVSKKAKGISDKYSNVKLQFPKEKIEIKKRKLNMNETFDIFSERNSKIRNRDLFELSLGKETVDIRALEQLVESGQVKYIGEIIKRIFTKNDQNYYDIKTILDILENRVNHETLMEILKLNSGNVVYARKYEIASVINRIRTNIIN